MRIHLSLKDLFGLCLKMEFLLLSQKIILDHNVIK